MRRWLFLLVTLLLCLAAVLLSRLTLFSGTPTTTVFTVDLPEQVRPDAARTMILSGRGLQSDARVSLVPHSGQQEAMIGRFPLTGLYNCAQLHAGVLYLGSSSDGVKAVLMGNPRKPRLLAEYLAGDSISDLSLAGDRLIVSTGSDGVKIFRILSNGALQLEKEIAVKGNVFRSRLYGTTLIMAIANRGLFFWDLQHQQQLFALPEEERIASFELWHDRLYVSARNSENVNIYRLRSGQLPVRCARLSVQASPRDLCLWNDRLYISTQQGIELYALTASLQPQRLSRLDGQQYAGQIYPAENSLYLSGFGRLSQIQTEDDQLSASTLNASVDARTVTEVGETLFVTGYANEGMIFARNKLTVGSQRAVQPFHGSTRAFFRQGNNLFIAADRGGLFLRSLDGGELRQLSPLRSLSLSQEGDLLYVAHDNGGVSVWDQLSSSSPRQIMHWPQLRARALMVAQGRLYLNRGSEGFSAYSLSGLQPPRLLAQLDSLHVVDMTVDDRQLFLACNYDGLQLCRLANDGSFDCQASAQLPFPMNRFANAVDVVVQGEMAYVANGASGVMVVDLSDPLQPQIVDMIDSGGFVKEVLIAGERLLVSMQSEGVKIYDIAEPERPRLQNQLPLNRVSRGMLVHDGQLYLGHYSQGLTVLALPTPLLTTRLSAGKLSLSLPAELPAGHYDLQIAQGDELITLEDRVVYR